MFPEKIIYLPCCFIQETKERCNFQNQAMKLETIGDPEDKGPKEQKDIYKRHSRTIACWKHKTVSRIGAGLRTPDNMT